jgi:hypothetical protein
LGICAQHVWFKAEIEFTAYVRFNMFLDLAGDGGFQQTVENCKPCMD